MSLSRRHVLQLQTPRDSFTYQQKIFAYSEKPSSFHEFASPSQWSAKVTLVQPTLPLHPDTNPEEFYTSFHTKLNASTMTIVVNKFH